MRRITPFLVALFVVGLALPPHVTTLFAQATPGNVMVLREGTDIRLRFAEPLSSKTAAEDDQVTFVLDEDVKVGDVVVLRSGTKGVGSVSHVKKAGRMGKGGELNVRLDYLAADGQRVKIRGTKGREGEDKVGTTVALTVLFGPIGLLKRGKQVEVKEGTVIPGFIAADATFPVTR